MSEKLLGAGTPPLTAISRTCKECSNLFALGPLSTIEGIPHHDYNSLKISARSGCEICALLLAQIKQSGIDQIHLRELQTSQMHCFASPYSLDWSIVFKLGSKEVAFITLLNVEGMFNWSNVNQYESENPFIHHEIDHDYTGAAPNMTLAREWLQICKETHPDCIKASKIHHNLPSRLIDLGLPERNDQLRLCITENMAFDIEYATLSHCWGTLEFLKLSRENFVSFQQSIPFKELTKTFQDTIQLVRQFGFRYLWIDSLCIVQDNREDWSKEAPRMASVYGGSSLNVAATGASDGSKGLFFQRDPDSIKKQVVLPDLTRDPSYEDILRHYPEYQNDRNNLHYCIDSAIYLKSFISLPLIQRAWVIQERFLAPRTLHFGQSQIMWECQAKVCLETFPNGLPLSLTTRNEAPWITRRSLGLGEEWASLICQYSHCALTQGSDKLIAISGVAEELARRYGAQYAWGLWTEHLPQTLLWELDTYGTRPLPLRAPTWSWASVDGSLIMGRVSANTLRCQFLAIKTPEDDNSAEANNSALIIKCEKILEITHLERWNPNSGEKMYKVSISKDSTIKSTANSFYFSTDEISLDRPNLIPKMYLLKICELQFQSEFQSSLSTTEETGLILQAVIGRRGYFRRLGIYKAGRDDYHAFTTARNAPADDADLNLHESRCAMGKGDEKEMFLINLI